MAFQESEQKKASEEQSSEREQQWTTAADQEQIGPALVQVALTDASPGHRQEAIYSLGLWRSPAAAELFRKLLQDHPLPALRGGITADQYWPYRYRLVALLGLARLGDEPARDELKQLHDQGGPAEKMDALLAMRSLDEAPAWAWDDLASTEPKLLATAVRLIAEFGTPADRAKLKEHFRGNPLWQEFRDSGIDDQNILSALGGEQTDE